MYVIFLDKTYISKELLSLSLISQFMTVNMYVVVYNQKWDEDKIAPEQKYPSSQLCATQSPFEKS